MDYNQNDTSQKPEMGKNLQSLNIVKRILTYLLNWNNVFTYS